MIIKLISYLYILSLLEVVSGLVVVSFLVSSSFFVLFPEIKIWRQNKMVVVLCNDDTCVPPKCPIVDVQEDKVIIGEKDNVCTLTREQFNILKEKIKTGVL